MKAPIPGFDGKVVNIVQHCISVLKIPRPELEVCFRDWNVRGHILFEDRKAKYDTFGVCLKMVTK